MNLVIYEVVRDVPVPPKYSDIYFKEISTPPNLIKLRKETIEDRYFISNSPHENSKETETLLFSRAVLLRRLH